MAADVGALIEQLAAHLSRLDLLEEDLRRRIANYDAEARLVRWVNYQYHSYHRSVVVAAPRKSLQWSSMRHTG